jgi:hypothetical protein
LRRWLQISVIVLAGAMAFVPWPPPLVERYFARGFYARVQGPLTSWSNQTGVALFDFLLLLFVGIVVVVIGRSIGGAIRRRSGWPLLRGVVRLVTVGAVMYLWFLAAWGFNYGRPPLEGTLGYDAGRVTPAEVRALATRATEAVNRLHAAGHAAGFPTAAGVPPTLVQAMHDVEARLGRRTVITPSRPKRSLLGPFFRAAGVDGMHAPFLLETLLNPDLTPPERPAVLAHEWAHLAGYAPEDDASFVGLLAALRGDAGAQYSGWLALFHETIVLLPRKEQEQLVARLEAGPRRDRQAIIERQQQRVEVVSRASWETYDRYLKAQGVPEGIESYSRVVQLLLGTGALDWQ